ncbi:MAG: response regulator transcription factor [Alphaproteobacteria bacterium GM202ARS2]|nr:response regulator transcription factor [Alphaproteobacteria bacterium GM202ARS2]
MWHNKEHILIVDDDERIRSLLVRYLRQHDYFVAAVSETAEADRLMACFRFDLVVLDVMLPGESGIEWAQRLRQRRTAPIPILMLTAMGGVADRVKGLQSGVDDYLVKPFEPQELRLRMAAIMRRARSRQVSAQVRFGAFTFDSDSGSLRLDGQRVPLSASERVLLTQLARQANVVLSRKILCQALDIRGDERVVDTQIKRLRDRLATVGSAPLPLYTIRGQGYVLQAHNVQA